MAWNRKRFISLPAFFPAGPARSRPAFLPHSCFVNCYTNARQLAQVSAITFFQQKDHAPAMLHIQSVTQKHSYRGLARMDADQNPTICLLFVCAGAKPEFAICELRSGKNLQPQRTRRKQKVYLAFICVNLRQEALLLFSVSPRLRGGFCFSDKRATTRVAAFF